MDYSLRTAGQTTHLKIVAVALVSTIAVVAVGINAKSNDVATSGAPARSAVMTAGHPATLAAHEGAIIR